MLTQIDTENIVFQKFPVQKQYSSIENCISEKFLKQSCILSYHEISILFLDEFSKLLMRDNKSRMYPEIISFAFWIRKANVLKMINNIPRRDETQLVARGVTFHLAPSNVDIMFLYSWVLSLLAGNINIVRISQQKSELVDFVITHLNTMAKNKKYSLIVDLNRIITYDRNSNINQYISKYCRLRILWGGDQTVNNFKKYITPAFCKDVSFSDKFSYAVIKSSEYNMVDSANKNILITNFYNDSYWFDQMACSSPQIIYFVGSDSENSIAAAHFKTDLDKLVTAKRYKKLAASNMDHLVNWYKYASKDIQRSNFNQDSNSSTFINVSLNTIDENYKTCGAGLFLITYLETLNDLTQKRSSKDQTMTYYGFSKLELKEFINNKNVHSPSRIVPVGKALDFSAVWDGYELLVEFVKVVELL
jgi:hypothetical protein